MAVPLHLGKEQSSGLCRLISSGPATRIIRIIHILSKFPQEADISDVTNPVAKAGRIRRLYAVRLVQVLLHPIILLLIWV